MEYGARVKFLEDQLKTYPEPKISITPGYGFKEIGKNFRCQKAPDPGSFGATAEDS